MNGTNEYLEVTQTILKFSRTWFSILDSFWPRTASSIYSFLLYPSVQSVQQGCFSFQKVMCSCAIYYLKGDKLAVQIKLLPWTWDLVLVPLSDIIRIPITTKWNSQILSFSRIQLHWLLKVLVKRVFFQAGPLRCSTVACPGHRLCAVLVCLSWKSAGEGPPAPAELGSELDGVTGEMSATAESRWAGLPVKKKAKYGFVPAASRTAHDSYVFTLTMLCRDGKSVVNMWPAGEERRSIPKTWKWKSLVGRR